MADLSMVTGGRRAASEDYVSADQGTVRGDGTSEDPLRVDVDAIAARLTATGTYTGNGTGQIISTGLGSPPRVILIVGGAVPGVQYGVLGGASFGPPGLAVVGNDFFVKAEGNPSPNNHNVIYRWAAWV